MDKISGARAPRQEVLSFMTKIDIFSGFLGAGKTTLIKKLIAEAYTGEKIVLIENEFVTQPQLDGGWLYFEDDSRQLARMSLASGAREVLGPPEEDPRRPVQYAVSARHVIKAEIAEGDSAAKVQLKLLRADKPVD